MGSAAADSTLACVTASSYFLTSSAFSASQFSGTAFASGGISETFPFCDRFVSLVCKSHGGLKWKESQTCYVLGGKTTYKSSLQIRCNASGTNTPTGDSDISSCKARCKALLFFRNRSSSAMSGVGAYTAAAGATTFRASRFSEMAADSFWVAARADFSWVSSALECSFFGDHIFVLLVYLLHSGNLCNSPRKSPTTLRRE